MSFNNGFNDYECRDEKTEAQKNNAAPMPWIGLYIALASLICFLAMAADTFYGFRSRRLWFPCRFFSLNAASLTLLAVAVKLTVDLNATFWRNRDQVAKLGSIVLLTTALGNFITSLGSMDNQAVLANVTALGILVITVIVNIRIHLTTDPRDYRVSVGNILGTLIMLFLFLSFVSSSLFVPTTKKYIEAKYQEKRLCLNEETEERGKLSIMNLKSLVKRYWVMATTGNPQFVMTRSVICATSGFISLLSVLPLVEGLIRMNPFSPDYNNYFDSESDYKWSTSLILLVQSLGVAVGIVPPTFRWFIVVSIVVASKLLLLLHAFLLSPVLLFINHVRRKFKRKHESESSPPTNQNGDQSEPGNEQDLNRYVLLLEGEARLPDNTLRNIFFEVDRLLLEGKKRKPKALLELLERVCSLNSSVADFDNDRIPCLYSLEPPNCWNLPIVTLTSIALALPNIENRIVDCLLRSVSEGLLYVNLIQKYQGTDATVVHNQNTADSLWVGVELYRKWLDLELGGNLEGTNSKKVLQDLTKTAVKIFTEFKMKTNEKMVNPIHWPLKIIAANSMYRISKTILLSIEGDNEITDEQLFEKLSVTIVDIFASCFTNLPRIITLKCQCDAIEKRESSVREAALLLGETENILEIVQQRQLSSTAPNQVVACIDDWRVSVKNRNTVP